MESKDIFSEAAVGAYYEKVRSTTTRSGFPVKEIYTPEDIRNINYGAAIADAGEYPFTRGIHPNMYRGRLWTIRQGWGFGMPRDINDQLKYLFQQGNTGLSIFVDNPTVAGIDPDHPLAEGEVGRVGASFCSVEDMEEILEGIPLDRVSLTLLGQSCAARVTLALFIAAAQKKGFDISRLRGTSHVDPLHSHYCRGKEFNPIDLGVNTVVDMMEYTAKNMPLWNTPGVNSYDLRETGITAPQEIAFGLAIAIAYIKGGLERGLGIDEFAPRLSFYCAGGMDFFEEVAKLRAMRRMWAKIVKERFGAQDPRSWKFRFAAQTTGSSLTMQQPLNNIVRVAYQALALVCGGAQSIFCCTYNEAESVPSKEAQLTALRTQQILAHETGVARVADPLGGSYYVEYLTNKMEAAAAKILKDIEDMGGMTEALRTEWVDRQIEKSAFDLQKKIEGGEYVRVGVNAFVMPPEEDHTPPGKLCKILRRAERERITRVKRMKKARNRDEMRRALIKLREGAQKKENVIPPLIEAARVKATMEEMLGTIREAWGYSYDPFGMRRAPF